MRLLQDSSFVYFQPLPVFPAALWPVAAIEVYTAKEVDAVNGTKLRLKCTFSSSSPISPLLSVTWNFQPEDLSSHEPVSETLLLHFIPVHFALMNRSQGPALAG